MPTIISALTEDWCYMTDTSQTSNLLTLLARRGWRQTNSDNGSTRYSTPGPYASGRGLVLNTTGGGIAFQAQAGRFFDPIGELHYNIHVKPSTASGVWAFMALFDGANVQLQIGYNASTGRMEAARGSTVVATSTSTGLFVANTWVELKCRFLVANSGGRIIIRVNNVEEINFTGDTQQTANATVNDLRLTSPNVLGSTMAFANLVGYSDSASWPLPEQAFLVGLVNAAGHYTQMTPSAGSNNANVDEQQPDFDATFNHSDTPGLTDSFGTDLALSPSRQITMARFCSWWRKTTAGDRSAEQGVRIAGTDHWFGAQEVPVEYGPLVDDRLVSPATSAAWTPAELNALELMVRDAG